MTLCQVVRRKLVIVGDGATGKSCLLNVFRSGKFPAMYEPTVYESFTVRVDVDDTPVCFTCYNDCVFMFSTLVTMSHVTLISRNVRDCFQRHIAFSGQRDRAGRSHVR